jgi:hypothetical protein
MKLEFFPQNFEKCSNIKFNENPASGSRVVPCGRAKKRGQTYEDNKVPKGGETGNANIIFPSTC